MNKSQNFNENMNRNNIVNNEILNLNNFINRTILTFGKSVNVENNKKKTQLKKFSLMVSSELGDLDDEERELLEKSI